MEQVSGTSLVKKHGNFYQELVFGTPPQDECACVPRAVICLGVSSDPFPAAPPAPELYLAYRGVRAGEERTLNLL